MDGNISVESEPDKGSFFTVRLPQEIVNEEVIGHDVAENLRQFRMNFMSKRKRAKIARDPMPYGSVLIVDDVETNIYVAVGLMKLYRLKIDTSMNGQGAIDKIKEGNIYDVIFMDHMMPEMDGIETTKHIRALGYTSPIVALTANAVAGQADVFMRKGFDEFISKPIDIHQLNSILNKFIRDKQPPEVIEAARIQKAELNNSHTQSDSLLMESFIRDANKTISWLEKKYNNNDLESEKNLQKFTVITHGIKSSLWNINETELADISYMLETSGREILSKNEEKYAKNKDFINKTVPEFIIQLRTLLDKIDLKQSKPAEDFYENSEDTEYILDQLKIIQETAADYDRKGTLDAISKIKTCSEKTKAFLDKINELVIHSEFEAAQKTASDLENILRSKYNENKPQISLLNTKISGLDIIKGLKRYEGNENIYLKVLRSYAASTRSMLSAIEDFSTDTLNNYKIKIHGIKGSSLDIFAEQIGKEAVELDNAAKAGDMNYINEHNRSFLLNAWKLVKEIEELLSKLEEENPKPKKDKPDNSVLLMFYSACKDYDMDGADRAIAEIEKYKYESDDGLADWLRDSIDKMDFKQIVQKLSYLNK